ncbi:MAG: glycosyltransferase [Candidatus Omnitrophica bacterium]|nr:glycosyltransferase [Candidatus Omnitrophota bacterium]
MNELNNSKKKIAIFVNKKLPGNDFRLKIASELKDTYDFNFFWPSMNGNIDGIKYYYLRMGEGFSLWSEWVNLLDLFLKVNTKHFDIYHFYSTKLYILGPLFILSGNKKSIITISGLGRLFVGQDKWIKKIMRKIFLRLLKLSSRRAACVLFQNRIDEKELKMYIPKGKNILVGSAVSMKPFNDYHKDVDRSKFNVIFVGRLHPSKGIYDYLEVCKKIKNKRVDIVFWLAGDISRNCKSLHQKIINEEKNGYLNYLGFRYDIIKYLNSCNALLFLSQREGMPRVVLEAGTCGLPVISYDIPGCSDVIIHEKTGFLEPLGDIDAVVRDIEYLADNRDEAKKMGIELKKYIEENYSMSILIEKIRDIYNNILMK